MGGLAQGFASLVAGEMEIEKKHFTSTSINCIGLILIPIVGSRGCLLVGSLLLVLANMITYWNNSLNSILSY